MLARMGMFDTILFVDDAVQAACSAGHRIRSVQTKDFEDPAMRTYLVQGARLLLASPQGGDDDDGPGVWSIEGSKAVRQHRFDLTEVSGVRSLRVYTSCSECQPVFVRTDGSGWAGDLVTEQQVFVDFRLTLRHGEPLQIERTSGSRDELKADLLARGLCVLGDDEPLAIAHRELRAARQRQVRHAF